MKIEFIPTDYDYFDFEGRNYIRIYGRNEKGMRVCLIDTCPIYFWAILKENISEEKIHKIIENIKKIKIKNAGRTTDIEGVEIHNKNFLGKEVKALKIFATNYKDLHDIADHLGIPEIEKRRGYDLGFITHYIIEKKINPLQWYEIEGEVIDNSEKFGSIDKILEVDLCMEIQKHKEIKKEEFEPKVLCYDIETDSIKIGQGEILTISLVGKNFKKVITYKKAIQKEDYIEYVKNEKELIEKFIEYVKKISPDFLVGYFSDGFDMPYLKSRAEKHKIKLSLSLDGSQPIFSRGIMQTAKTKGISHIDLLRFIRTAYGQYMQSETLSLNEVAKEFLGDSKKEFEFKHSSKIQEKEWDKYFEYNLHDSLLVYNLFEKFWPDILEFSKITKEPPVEITRAGLSKYTESYILHNLEKFNEIPEKKPIHEELSKRRKDGSVEGAFVLEPTPGLYEKVVMFDFTSMHTSIIISMNLSKSTLLEKEEKNSNSIETTRGKFYFTKKPGFLPLMLKEIFEKRKKFKEEYKKNPDPITKARSNAFKVLSASVHGYIAFFGARYYSKEASASVLAYVRKFNKETIDFIEKKGYKVLYGDTDSIAFQMNNNSKEEIKNLLKELNSKLPGIMELELEGFFKRGLWVTTRAGITGAKKKYALLGEDEKIKIRGFETVRRDWCNLARELQNKVIRLILENGKKDKALEYAKEIIKKIKDREIKKEDLIIKSQLTKSISEYKAISPHVIAAKKMEIKKIPISPGTIISYYIAETSKKTKLIREKVKLPDEKGEYDINYYLDHQIIPAVENIFQVFNINTKEIADGKRQTKLGDF
jgi:DNA polymerase I/DNA polymerase-2